MKAEEKDLQKFFIHLLKTGSNFRKEIGKIIQRIVIYEMHIFIQKDWEFQKVFKKKIREEFDKGMSIGFDRGVQMGKIDAKRIKRRQEGRSKE